MVGVLLLLTSCHFNWNRAYALKPPPHPRDHRADEPETARHREIAEHRRAIHRRCP